MTLTNHSVHPISERRSEFSQKETKMKSVHYSAQCDDIQLSSTYEMYVKEGEWKKIFPDGYNDTLVDGKAFVEISLARGGSITLTLSEIQALCQHINKFASDRTDKAIDFAIEIMQDKLFPETDDDIFDENINDDTNDGVANNE